MIESISSKLKSWAQTHLSPLKIDFMSLNRLRLNQRAESVFEDNIPYVEQSKKGLLDLRAYLPDTAFTYENPKVLLNPFGMAPLFAVIIFYTENNTSVSYCVKGHRDETSFSRHLEEYSQTHLVPIVGLYPSEANIVTLTIYDDNKNMIAKKDIVISTGSLPYDMYQDDCLNYLTFLDKDGDIRYYIDLRTNQETAALLPNHHLALVENVCMTPNYMDKSPTHFHDIDLFGFTYRTYYVATGIDHIDYDADNNYFYIQSHEQVNHFEDAVLEMSPQTGEVNKIHHTSPISSSSMTPISFEQLADWMTDNTVEDFLNQFTLSPDSFSIVGWLSSPKPHKGASIQTTDCITKEELFTEYGVRIVLAGDAIHVTMHQEQIQEILFSKFDEIFQTDYSSYITKENPVVSESYTIAIPLSELHSGTYSVILRFVNGNQAVIADALRLSRTRI